MATKAKPQPKTFTLHWGSGIIEEEAQFAWTLDIACGQRPR